MKYKAFLFDMDGVITETSDQHYMAWKELADELGIEIDLKFNENLKGISRMESLEKILVYGNKEDKFTEDEKFELATRKNRNYLNLIEKFTRDNLFEGVEALLEKLKSLNVKIVLTSASKNAPALLKKLEIEEYFDFVVNPALVKGKPNPDIFLEGARMAGFPSELCVGVEDAESGIEAIKRAGMLAIGIGHHLDNADINLDKTAQVIDLLDKL